MVPVSYRGSPIVIMVISHAYEYIITFFTD